MISGVTQLKMILGQFDLGSQKKHSKPLKNNGLWPIRVNFFNKSLVLLECLQQASQHRSPQGQLLNHNGFIHGMCAFTQGAKAIKRGNAQG